MGMKNNDRFLAGSQKRATVVFDKGRRGNPLAGCDCVQCFGYCMINGDEAARVKFAQATVPEDKDLMK